LDCSLEFKKGESPTNIELSKEEDFEAVLKMEEEFIEKMCKDIIKHKPTLVFTEKGVSGTWREGARCEVLRAAARAVSDG
jgi:T-complex protein 1 subunit gamma